MSEYNRVRLQDKLGLPTRVHITSFNGSGTKTADAWVSTKSVTGSHERCSDVKTPNFKQRKKRGEIIMNDVLVERYSRDSSLSGYCKQGPYSYWANAYDVMEGDITGWVEEKVGFEPSITGDCSSIASIQLTKCYAEMNQSAILSGEILSEISQTVSMLRRPMASSKTLLSKISKSWKRSKWRTARDSTKALSDAWLEHRYGWKPIFYDAESIMKEANKKASGRLERKVVRSTGRTTSDKTKSFSNIPLVYIGWGATGAVRTSQKGSGSAGVIYEVVNRTATQELDRIAGTRARDLPATIWEVLPYSFVVDWFVNVGDWLQAISPTPGINVVGAWTTVVNEIEITYYGGVLSRYVYVPGATYITGSYGGSNIKMLTYMRNAHPVLASSPVWKSETISRLHSVDALTLSLQSIKTDLGKMRH